MPSIVQQTVLVICEKKHQEESEKWRKLNETRLSILVIKVVLLSEYLWLQAKGIDKKNRHEFYLKSTGGSRSVYKCKRKQPGTGG
jgi:hypothetical protein